MFLIVEFKWNGEPLQSERYHYPARHWDGLHASERFCHLPERGRGPVSHGRFRESLRDGCPLSALDIGVGGGRHTRLLCELGFETFGVDVSAEGLKQTAAMLAGGLHAHLEAGADDRVAIRVGLVRRRHLLRGLLLRDRRGHAAAMDELHRVLKAGGEAFVVLRTTDDFRHGKGEALEPDTYLLKISETNEEGTVQHFLSEAAVPAMFAGFAHLEFEKTETTFAARMAKNSDWLISLRK